MMPPQEGGVLLSMFSEPFSQGVTDAEPSLRPDDFDQLAAGGDIAALFEGRAGAEDREGGR